MVGSTDAVVIDGVARYIPSIGRHFTNGSFTPPDNAAGQLEAMADEFVRLGRASRALQASSLDPAT